jgi:endonuclease/exonuclease/phosphatase family metal-dependent hydrolase
LLTGPDTGKALAFVTGLVLTGFLMPVTVIASHETGSNSPECNLPLSQNVITSPLLSVLTLNLAHGRKDAFNQMLQKTSTTRRNLEEIADFLRNSGADLIALQEADAPSRWSGKFNHVDFVSEKSPYPCRIHASHAHNRMYDFGTALLSRVPYTDSLSHTFAPSPPTTNKGFVMGKVLWNPDGQLQEPITVSIISVHLDFSRKKVREAQTEEMRAMLPDMTTPVIILGDFNTDWTTDESALRAIVANGNLKVYQPEATELGTYKNGKHRLDWILISKDLEFVSYEVPQVVLSDHQPVLASVRLLENSLQESERSDHD